jgi:hypothetical protein
MNRDRNLLVRYRWSFVLAAVTILWVIFVENAIDASFVVKLAVYAAPIVAICALLVVNSIRSGSGRR